MRQFGIIASSIWRSKRFRLLTTDLARLVYIYLHTTTHGNSAGAFIVSPELAALELKRDGSEVRAAFEELAECRLIRYDPEEEMVQIVNFFRFNSPTSRKHLAGPLRIINEALPQSPTRDAAAVELILAMYERATGWDKGVEARGVFLNEAAKLVKSMHLQALLCSDEFGLDIELLIGLSDDLLIDLPIQGEGKDHGDNKTTDKTKTTTTDKTTTRGASQNSSGSARSAPGSSLDRGEGQGLGKASFQADIDALNRRAKGGG